MTKLNKMKKMKIAMNKHSYTYLAILFVVLTFTGCKTPSLVQRTENKEVPLSFNDSKDTTNSAQSKRKDYFTDV